MNSSIKNFFSSGSKDSKTSRRLSSSLRKWLNETFISSFSTSESSYILQSTVHDSNGDTQDKVFILSEDELVKYYPNREDRIVDATMWAIMHTNHALKLLNCYKPGDEAHSDWWLRSCSEAVDYDGECHSYSPSPDTEIGVRPVMWLDTSKI